MIPLNVLLHFLSASILLLDSDWNDKDDDVVFLLFLVGGAIGSNSQSRSNCVLDSTGRRC
jgi:hypothetical protein